MGRGFNKRKNAMKKQYLNTAVKYIERLEKENEALKTSPDTLIGQIIPQFREAMGQNKRLSALTATLLKMQGGKATVTKEDIESFEGFALNIKWELPEGVEKPEDAKEYIFTYEAVPQPQQTIQTDDTPEVVKTEEQIQADLQAVNVETTVVQEPQVEAAAVESTT